MNYPGGCVNEFGECTEHLDLTLKNIKGDKQPNQCSLSDFNCQVSFKIKNFELETHGNVELKLSEAASYCTSIQVKVKSSSSILDEYSSITSTISSDKKKYFIGSEPSNFYFVITPSLFVTDSDESEGYHVSTIVPPTLGSQVDFSE